ncbi:MAG: hypothetical protein MJE66_14105 [Proteobacteria bacterium]|nr:hypothetical protein [Pseudomonadota bacterium]
MTRLAIATAACVFLCGAASAEMRLDPAARLPSGRAAFEHWDFTIELESGHRVLARFTITNAGPGDRNGIAIGHVIPPEGKRRQFRNGRRAREWQLSSDRLSLVMGKSALDWRSGEAHLKISKKSVQVDLKLDVRRGHSLPASALPDGLEIDLLDASAPVHGRIFLRGMAEPLAVTGRAAVTHTVGRRGEGALLRGRAEFFAPRAEPPVAWIHLQHASGRHTNAWLLARGESNRLVTEDVQAESSGRLPGTKDGFVAPVTWNLAGPWGKTLISLQSALLAHDPREDLPTLLRMAVSSKIRPVRVWAPGGVLVTLAPSPGETHPLLLKGSGLSVVTFLGPADLTQAPSKADP